MALPLHTVRHYSHRAMKSSRSPQAIAIYSYTVVCQPPLVLLFLSLSLILNKEWRRSDFCCPSSVPQHPRSEALPESRAQKGAIHGFGEHMELC